VLIVTVLLSCAACFGPVDAAQPPVARILHLRSATGQAELLMMPTTIKVTGLVVFMHGVDSDQNQPLHDDQLFPITRALLADGYAIVSSNGHGNNAGSPVSVQDQRDALDDAEAHLPPIETVNILAFSMGGLDALLTAAGHTFPKLHAVALLSPVCDQITFLNSSFRGVIASAFGGANGSALVQAVNRSDPVKLSAAKYPRVCLSLLAEPVGSNSARVAD